MEAADMVHWRVAVRREGQALGAGNGREAIATSMQFTAKIFR